MSEWGCILLVIPLACRWIQDIGHEVSVSAIFGFSLFLGLYIVDSCVLCTVTFYPIPRTATTNVRVYTPVTVLLLRLYFPYSTSPD